MDAYISKPLRMQELGILLNKWLPLPDQNTEINRSVMVSEKEALPLALPVWDANTLTKMVGNNPTMHHRLLEKFLIKAGEQMTAIRSSATLGDTTAISEVAHAFKSAARTVGALQLGELCQEMEMTSKNGNVADCHALLNQLNTAFESAIVSIKNHLSSIRSD